MNRVYYRGSDDDILLGTKGVGAGRSSRENEEDQKQNKTGPD
jgi:hypothetical protein